MARMMEIGVILPSVAVQRSEHLDLRSAARLGVGGSDWRTQVEHLAAVRALV